MGYGAWSGDDYDSRARVRSAAGKSAFSYSDDTLSKTPRNQWRVHPKLDPKGITRESRDSASHPESLSIATIFDVTGSMRDVPRIIQRNLPRLMGLMLQKEWVEHPQILFGAVGDATCDFVPLQIGQFESDINMEDDLGRFVLEGGGGGQATESYELAIYMATRHFSMDCFEKRGKKGYLFLTGDEMPYPRVSPEEVKSIIGDDIGESITIENIIAEAKEKYHVFMLRPTNTEWGRDSRVQTRWEKLLGKEYVVRLEYPEAIAETIALITGLTEGKVSLEDGISELLNMGETALSAEIIRSLAESLGFIPAPSGRLPRKKTDATVPTAAEPKSGKKKPGRI